MINIRKNYQRTENFKLLLPHTDLISEIRNKIIGEINLEKNKKASTIKISNRSHLTSHGLFNKNTVKNISRLRFNHTLAPSHLYKINMKDNPNCECGEIGHRPYFVKLPTKKAKINELINNLCHINILRPFNLLQLL